MFPSLQSGHLRLLMPRTCTTARYTVERTTSATANVVVECSPRSRRSLRSLAQFDLGGHGMQFPVAPVRACRTVSSGRQGRRRHNGPARRGRAAAGRSTATLVLAVAPLLGGRGARGCGVRRARLESPIPAASTQRTEGTRARPPRTSASAGRPSPADAGDWDHRPLRRHHPADGQRLVTLPPSSKLRYALNVIWRPPSRVDTRVLPMRRARPSDRPRCPAPESDPRTAPCRRARHRN